MVEAVGCADCHDPTKPHAPSDIAQACASCHEEQGPKDLQAWQEQLRAAHDKVQYLEEQIQMNLAGLRRRQANTAPFTAKVEAVRARVAYLDRARGVHNMKVALPEYERAAKELQALLDEMTKPNP
jgi:formate-dependent nitrite reductase cytochrome c552 subunit